ncbi:MAG: PAS domain S-box protein [Deltaproteobacteria bacterium]|nr:PAS domain S-box protein [Deltaproteobacteria bacterium]
MKSSTYAVLDNLLEGCQIIDPEYRYIYANEAVARHGQTTRENLIGWTMMEAYPGIETTAMFRVLRACLKDRISRSMENEFELPDGTRGWFDLRFEPVPEGVLILSIDITDRKKTETSLQRTNRALATLSSCNQALVRATEEAAFVREVCRIVVRSGYPMAWIGMAVNDEIKSVLPVAAEGPAEGYVDGGHVTWGDGPRGLGPTGRAIRSGEAVYIRNIPSAPNFDLWRDEATVRGLASVISLPFRIAGETAGAITIYAAEPDAFDHEEKTLLAEVALDLGAGLTSLRSRATAEKTDAELRELQEHYRLLIEQLPVGVAVNSEGKIVFANPAGAAILGVRSPNDLMGKQIADIIPPEGIADAVDRIQRMLDGETGLYPVEETCLRLDGSRVPVEIRAVPMTYMGKPSVQVVITDISERKESETALAKANTIYRTLFESTDHAVLIIDDGKVFDCNETAVRMFGGRLKDDLCGNHPALFSPECQPDGADSTVRLNEHFAAALASGKERYEWTHRKLGSNEKFIADVLLSRMNVDGRPVLQATVRDVTVQKHLEQERAALQRQLEIAQRMEAVGRLAGGIAHDFNNLLSVIINYAEFAEEALPEGDPIRQDVEEIRDAGVRAAALTRQLLAFSRKQILEPDVLDLNHVVKDLEKILRRVLNEDIDIVFALAPDLGTVKADPSQIEQVIMNLVVNSKDAMPSGESSR